MDPDHNRLLRIFAGLAAVDIQNKTVLAEFGTPRGAQALDVPQCRARRSIFLIRLR